MGKLRLEVLSQAEIEKLHQRSLDVLEKVGVRVLDAECQQVLVRAGAKMDDGSDKVYLPRRLAEEALAQAPSTFEMHRQDGKVLKAGGDHRVYGSLVIDPWIIDYETQKPRRPVLNDVTRHAQLGDAHPIVDMIYRMDMPPDDVPPETGYIKTMEAFVTNMTKHLVAAPASVESTQDWLEVAEILVGERNLAEHPIITLSVPVTTPLIFNEINGYILRTAVRKGIPITAQTEPIAGTTAPLSFAGGLLMANAENVFLIVVAQLLKPGAPISYSTGHALTDLRTGHAIFYNGDKMLWQIADIQMANFYHLPIWSSLGGSMVGRYDVQCGIEQTLLMLPAVSCGLNLLNGIGSCYNACGMSAEMIVIQADLAQLLERISAGIDTSDEKLAFDSIVAVGPGGHFLEDPLTIKMLRSGEFFTKGSFDRLGERSPNDPQDSMLVRAHERVEELLATHVPAVPEKIVEEIHRWARHKEQTLPAR